MFYLNLLLLRKRYLLNILYTLSAMTIWNIWNITIRYRQINILSVGLYLRRHLLLWYIYNHTWIHVFTFFAFTILSTLNTSLITFTILLYTMWFFTITTFNMFRCLNSIIKALRILVESLWYRLVSFFLMIIIISTVYAITVFMTSTSTSKTIAVKFKAFWFFTVAGDLFVFLLRRTLVNSSTKPYITLFFILNKIIKLFLTFFNFSFRIIVIRIQ